jgi:hypothetical protein
VADAVAGALDRIHMWELDGALVYLAGGTLHHVNSEILREIIRANFVSKHIVPAAAGLGVEYRPVEEGELTVRTLLTAPPQQGGLVGREPMVQMEAPRQVMEEAAAVVSDPVEDAAGKAALAKHARQGSGQLRDEIAAGQRRLGQLRNG